MRSPHIPTPEQQAILAAARKARIDYEVAKRSRAQAIELKVNELRAQVIVQVDDAINAHARALDDAMLAAVDAGVPIRRIAFDAFGARHDASVRRMIHEALADRRRHQHEIGEVSGNDAEEPVALSDLPPMEVEIERGEIAITEVDLPSHILGNDAPVGAPRFTLVEVEHVLYEDGTERVTVPTVRVELDPLDPWIPQVREFARKGSEHRNTTVCTIYRNPGTGKMIALESSEPGSTFYDHLAARWVKDHQDEASAGYDAALATANA